MITKEIPWTKVCIYDGGHLFSEDIREHGGD